MSTIKEVSDICNKSEKNIYSKIKSTKSLKECVIYKGKKTFLNQLGLDILKNMISFNDNNAIKSENTSNKEYIISDLRNQLKEKDDKIQYLLS